MTGLHGWLILDKPLGLGSTQGVSAVKRALRAAGYDASKRGIKVGHGGTLDPLATGVLPIALGEATKLAGRMLDSDKVYDFTIGFGVETDTLDLEGKVIAESAVRPTLAQIEAVLPRFTGPIEQVPPAYSALKIDGERAYDLARAGADVVLAGRSIIIHNLFVRHPGRVPGSTGPGRGWQRLMTTHQPSQRTAAPAAQWTPEHVRGDGGYGARRRVSRPRSPTSPFACSELVEPSASHCEGTASASSRTWGASRSAIS